MLKDELFFQTEVLGARRFKKIPIYMYELYSLNIHTLIIM